MGCSDSDGYATVADYELRTGTTVPADQQDTVQQRLDDLSALISLYMGPCAEFVEAAYPDILTSLVCAAAGRSFSTSPGVKSESVGSTSVSYVDYSSMRVAGVEPPEADVLDALMASSCPNFRASGPKIGELGVGWGGGRKGWAADVDVWVASRW
jgi:hypothetical protein